MWFKWHVVLNVYTFKSLYNKTFKIKSPKTTHPFSPSVRGCGRERWWKSTPSRICIVVQLREPYRPLDRLCLFLFLFFSLFFFPFFLISVTFIDFFPSPIIILCCHNVCAIFDNWSRVSCCHEFSGLFYTTYNTLLPIRGMHLDFLKCSSDHCSFPYIRYGA